MLFTNYKQPINKEQEKRNKLAMESWKNRTEGKVFLDDIEKSDKKLGTTVFFEKNKKDKSCISNEEQKRKKIAMETWEKRTQDKGFLDNINDRKVEVLVEMENPKQPKQTKLDKDENKIPYSIAKRIMRDKFFKYIDNPTNGSSIYMYDGKYWKMLRKADLEQLIFCYLSENEKKENVSIDKFCANIASFIYKETAKEYENGNRFYQKDFEKIRNHICFENCVYDAENGKILKHTPTKPYVTKINANYLEGPKEKLKTTAFKKFKMDATGGDKESSRLIDLMIAYLLVPNLSGKCYFVMGTAKDSGKSVLGAFIESLFDESQVKKIDIHNMNNRFALGSVENKRILSCLDMTADVLGDTVVSVLKTATGERRLRSEEKYEKASDCEIRFKIMLGTNSPIRLKSKDDAFARRTIIIPFVKSTSLENIDANLPQKLEREKDRIVTKAVRRLKDVIDSNGGITIKLSPLSKKMQAEWFAGSEFEEEFIMQNIVFTGNRNDFLTKTEIYARYLDYCDLQDEQTSSVKMKMSKKDLICKIKNEFVGIEDVKKRPKYSEGGSPIASLCGITWKYDDSDMYVTRRQ